MSKKVIRSLCMVLSVAFVLVLATACGGSSKAGGKDKKVTVKLASWSARGNALESKDYIDYFQEKHQNITIDFMAITEGNYSEKLYSMIAANTAPDVMMAWECDIGRFAKTGAIIPLDEYVAKTDAFEMDDFVPALKQLGDFTGGTYGLPWCLAAEIAYYNKDMFDAAGVPYPENDWTWEDFENKAKQLTIIEDGKTVQWGCDAISFQGLWYSTIGATGEDIVDENGILVLGDEAKKALQWQYDLTNKFKVCPPPAASGTNAVDLFTAGKAAMTRAGNWMIGTYIGIEDFNWDIVPLPKDERQYTTLHTGLYCINAKSKVKDAAWTFIEYAMGDEGQEEICKQASNASARKSITAEGYYKVSGKTGPTNWDAYDQSVGFAQFGYVLANPGVTNAAVSNFKAVMMDQMSIDEAIEKANEEAQKIAE